MTSPVTARSTPRASRGVLVAIAAFATGYALAVIAAERAGMAPAVRVAFALLAVAGFVAFIAAEVRVIRGLDELQQRIQLETLAVAFPLALVLVFGVGMLERAGVSIWGFRELRDAWPLVALPYVVGLALALRRYR
jgi:hypothetical protein